MASKQLEKPKNGTTLSSWKKTGVIRGVTLPSGTIVDLRPLSLETHLTFGRTPDALRVIAISDVRAKLGNRDISNEERADALAQHVAHQRPLLVEMIVSPEVTEDDLAELPEQDIEWLIAFSNRAVTEDAAGRALGVEPLNRWATFRHEHGCEDGCEACLRVLETFSAGLG